MSKFLIVDSSHLFSRVKFVIKGEPDEIAGMALSTIFSSLGKLWRTQLADHIVFCFDSRSWRKDVYAPYKRNRTEKRALETPAEHELNRIFYEAFDVFKQFIIEHTNCTVLLESTLEADDLISGFLQAHPNDTHIIVSSDKDFEQLLTPNISMYNGITDQTITVNGIYDYKGKEVKDKKTGLPKIPPNPEWSLFEKAVRGCTTDNIFSAYPGVREKGSKNKVGLREAFEDRNKQGFNWSALMLTRWMDHNGLEHRVLDDYNRNLSLVNLKGQPDEIKTLINATVKNSCVPKTSKQLGFHFMKFCGRYELVKIGDQATYFSELLSAKYPG
jgi:5'-3' exonuclease